MRKKFRRSEENELFLFDTAVENIFLSEYMPEAPNDYVKIYLFALMYTANGYYMDNEVIAKHLRLEVEDVLKAWTYWENMGVVKKEYSDKNNRFEYDIEFLSLREQLYGNKPRVNEQNSIVNAFEDKSIKEFLKSIEKRINRPLGGNEPASIIAIIDEYAVSIELLDFCYSYCIKKGRTDIKYIEATIRNWSDKNIKKVEDAQNYLMQQDQRYAAYKRVMKALGFPRNATEAEQEKIDYWMDVLDFSLDRIVEACKKTSGISNPNINYVNSIIENWAKADGKNVVMQKESKVNKPVSAKDVQRYYDYLKKQAQEDAKVRETEIYNKIPQIKKIDEQIRESGVELSKIMVLRPTDAKKRAEEIRNHMNELMTEKAFLLTENDYPVEYMQIDYKCKKCKDSGVDDLGNRCSCYEERLREANLWQKQ
ncbi:MAG: DnaD domain protein [Eubacteriales bacterium]